MKERAKLFTSGGSQAVRLPKAYRFENQREVLISREGKVCATHTGLTDKDVFEREIKALL